MSFNAHERAHAEYLDRLFGRSEHDGRIFESEWCYPRRSTLPDFVMPDDIVYWDNLDSMHKNVSRYEFFVRVRVKNGLLKRSCYYPPGTVRVEESERGGKEFHFDLQRMNGLYDQWKIGCYRWQRLDEREPNYSWKFMSGFEREKEMDGTSVVIHAVNIDNPRDVRVMTAGYAFPKFGSLEDKSFLVQLGPLWGPGDRPSEEDVRDIYRRDQKLRMDCESHSSILRERVWDDDGWVSYLQRGCYFQKVYCGKRNLANKQKVITGFLYNDDDGKVPWLIVALRIPPF